MMRHKQETALQASEFKGPLTRAFPTLLRYSRSGQRGSGWVVDWVKTLWMDIARYQPLQGGSYISLLAVVGCIKAFINVKKDDHCLRWAPPSALFPANDHTDRSSKYPTQDGLNFEGIDTPTLLSQIQRVE